MEAPSSTATRRRIFGDERHHASYIVQSWYQRPDRDLPALWIERHARTLAGARRIAKSAGIVKGLRHEARITITRIELTEEVIRG